MIMFQELPKVYLYRDVIDFRKSINGLSAVVEQQMELPSTDGSVFVFCNRNRNKLKILYWDKTGFALWYKQLERDKFKWPTKIDPEQMVLSEQQFHWLLSGFDVVGHQRIFVESYC